MDMVAAVSPDALWGASLAMLAMLTYGCSMVAVSFAARDLSSEPGSVLAAASGVGAGVLAAAAAQWMFGSGIEMPGLHAFLWFAAAGVFSTWLGRWLVFKSIELMGPSRSAALQGLSPMVTALFAWLLLGQVLGPLGVIGMVLGVAGLVGISVGGAPQTAQRGPAHVARQAGWVRGSMLVGLLSAAAYSGSHVMRAAGVQTWNQPLLGAAIGAASGLAALVLASPRQLAGYAGQIRAHRSGAGLYLVIGVLQFIAQAMVIASMKYIPAAVASLITMCTPLVVMPISYFALRKQENLTPATVLGICITLAGLVLVVVAGRSHP